MMYLITGDTGDTGDTGCDRANPAYESHVMERTRDEGTADSEYDVVNSAYENTLARPHPPTRVGGVNADPTGRHQHGEWQGQSPRPTGETHSYECVQ